MAFCSARNIDLDLCTPIRQITAESVESYVAFLLILIRGESRLVDESDARSLAFLARGTPRPAEAGWGIETATLAQLGVTAVVPVSDS